MFFKSINISGLKEKKESSVSNENEESNDLESKDEEGEVKNKK